MSALDFQQPSPSVRVEVVPGYTDQAEFERDLAMLKVLASRVLTPLWDNTPTIEERLIFETMVFGDPYNNELTRYSTEEAAMRGHLATVDALRAGHEPFSWHEDGEA